MHIYGWPVKVSEAQYGWKSRKSECVKETKNLKAKKGYHREDYWAKGNMRDSRSFVDVVKDYRTKDDQKEDAFSEEEETMYLDRNIVDREWLKICAIGVLKEFSNFSSVKKKLIDRGFKFTMKYLGGKFVLWNFESAFESEGFIKSRFFWDDSFNFMKYWSESLDFQPMPVWVNISGFPLNYWNEHFFRKVGSQLREYLCPDHDSIHKKRLDRGRILISLKDQQPCPKKMKVVDGFKSFSAFVEMDGNPVDYDWVVGVLGLFESSLPESMEYSDRGEGNKSNGRQDRWQKVAGEMIDRRRVQKMSGQRSKVGERLGLQISHNLKVDGSMDNGKQAHVIISKRRTSHPTCLNDKLILEKQKVISGSEES
ncbi:hypothetical protein LWI28_009261 [Acer negundo]|uniref:DUF4283 domain-containing protein n=1 Tax=Acer negundo TaxID=4023 RepID=A0AAD5NWY0_ACENE|nr:hypothetical protein LWI28_009261 [Acer negundo]